MCASEESVLRVLAHGAGSNGVGGHGGVFYFVIRRPFQTPLGRDRGNLHGIAGTVRD